MTRLSGILDTDGDIQAAKKEKKEETEDEIAFKQKKKEDAEALKAAREKGERILQLIECFVDHHSSQQRRVSFQIPKKVSCAQTTIMIQVGLLLEEE